MRAFPRVLIGSIGLVILTCFWSGPTTEQNWLHVNDQCSPMRNHNTAKKVSLCISRGQPNVPVVRICDHCRNAHAHYAAKQHRGRWFSDVMASRVLRTGPEKGRGVLTRYDLCRLSVATERRHKVSVCMTMTDLAVSV